MELERSLCKACGEEMLWARTTNGVLQPFNAIPDPKGNCVIDNEGIAHVVKADLFDQEVPEGTRFMPHHATCSEAKKFRKKK